MTTYNWTISSLECVPSKDELTNIVQTIHWRLSATDDTDNISVESYGAQTLPEPNPDQYSQYEDLTLETVVGWLEGRMDVDTIKENLETQILEKRTPKIVNLPLPSLVIEEEIVEEEVIEDTTEE